MFHSILVPTDFSECSMLAFSYAKEMASKFGSAIHLIYVVEDYSQYWTAIGPESVPVMPVPTEIVGLAQKRLQAIAAKEFTNMTPAPTVQVSMGRGYFEICEYAKNNSIGLIVMATHGHGALMSMLLGSTTERVVREAPCAVMTVRAKL